MKKIWVLILIFCSLPAFCIEEIHLNPVKKDEINLSKENKYMKSSLLVENKEKLAELSNLQKEKDFEDIETLWKGTVENNQVIEFALKKLATPESQRRIHSSLMAKTLSAVVSGASFVPTMMGANAGIQTASFSAGRLAQGLLNKKNTPQEVPLTDTELIELTALIEDLQDNIINSYYNYKNALAQLKDIRAKIIIYNRNYSKAVQTGDILDINISGALYENMALMEYQQEQEAKKHYVELQRMCGKKAVSSLSLYKCNVENLLLKGSEK